MQTLTQHPCDWLTTNTFAYTHMFLPPPFQNPRIQEFSWSVPTLIGNDVWIGSGVKIKCGLKIGDGAIIGAGAVVTKDVAPFTIVAGVPARVMRKRFSSKLIKRIQACPWWAWDLTSLPLDWKQPERAQGHLEDAVAQDRVKPWNPGWRELIWEEQAGVSPDGRPSGRLVVRAVGEVETQS